MNEDLEAKLTAFATEQGFLNEQGPLCVALVVTQYAKDPGLPLDPDALITKSGGQVKGLGKSAVQKVLKRHGIERIFAEEGGRTSRGSIGNMREYVAFLNTLQEEEALDDETLDAIEKYWVKCVEDFFAGQPFKLKLEAGKGISAAIADLIAQGQDRQAKGAGTQYVGAMMQHLVGAKLETLLPDHALDHNSYSTSDRQSGRAGDFEVADTAFHVTRTPTEGLLQRCRTNLEQGRRPVIITSQNGVAAADLHAESVGIKGAVDVFEIEQFIATNLYEWSKFDGAQRMATTEELVRRYNGIIDEYETDPSLKIALQ